MMLIGDVASDEFSALLQKYELRVQGVDPETPIPGSYWGEHEAGLIGATLYVRNSTPIHSALHEASHFVCMDSERRQRLKRDAGGDHAEENAVCYLQIILADHVPGMDRARMFADMDDWGYTFRLGSAQAWFDRDADDAREWLLRHGIIDAASHATWRLR